VILVLIFSLGFSAPLYVARGAAMVLWVVKEFGLDLVARALSRRLLTALNDSVVEAINQLGVEGGKPGATFVQNWKRFLADAQRIGENQFRSQLSYVIRNGFLCGDLQGPLATAFQATAGDYINIGEPDLNAELQQSTLTPFQTKIKCTLPNSVREAFKKDFGKGGGWETWSRIVQPQNNLSGALTISLEELAKQRASQESARQNQVAAGSGFAGVQDSCKGFGANSKCSFLGEVVTPGDMLSEGAADWLDSNSKWFVSSDELSEVLINIINAAVGKLQNFIASKTFGLLGVPAGSSSQDNSASQAGQYTGRVQNDCIPLCITPKNNGCDNTNLFTFPETIDTCYAKAKAECDKQCAVP